MDEAASEPLINANALAARRRTFWLGPAMVAAGAVLVAGWFLPIMTVTKFWFWSNRVSIYGALKGLWGDREFFLLAVLLLFSMVFPLLKLIAGLWVWARVDATSPRARRVVGWIQFLGKWSMVDVFVVALAVVAIKISIVSDVAVHAGVYVFSAAIVLSMGLMHGLERALRPPR
jgi:paraquat-inducible protein A